MHKFRKPSVGISVLTSKLNLTRRDSREFFPENWSNTGPQ